MSELVYEAPVVIDLGSIADVTLSGEGPAVDGVDGVVISPL